jgi:hypothetical protein
MKGIHAVVVAALVASLGARPAGAITVVLPRAGQVGVSLQGQYGGMSKTGNLGKEFGNGGTMALRLVYRMRYERAIGLSFEGLRLDTRHATADSSGAFPAPLIGSLVEPVARKSLAINTEGFDVYQYFGTRTRTPKFITAGLGLAQVSAKQVDGETEYPLVPDGYYLSVGGGLERFVYRSWALDLSARYMGVLLDGQINHDVHAALGVILYAAY